MDRREEKTFDCYLYNSEESEDAESILAYTSSEAAETYAASCWEFVEFRDDELVVAVLDRSSGESHRWCVEIKMTPSFFAKTME